MKAVLPLAKALLQYPIATVIQSPMLLMSADIMWCINMIILLILCKKKEGRGPYMKHLHPMGSGWSPELYCEAEEKLGTQNLGFIHHIISSAPNCALQFNSLWPGPLLNIKTIFPRYGIPMLKIRHGDPYTGKTSSLYWDVPLVIHRVIAQSHH